MTYENLDKIIKQKIQSVERDIPGGLEERIQTKLEQIYAAPGSLDNFMPGKEKKTLLFVGALATAASLLLAVLLLITAFPSLFHPERPAAPGGVLGVMGGAEDGAFVDSARVEGVPADTIIIDQKDPDMTIIWIEKTPIMAKNS